MLALSALFARRLPAAVSSLLLGLVALCGLPGGALAASAQQGPRLSDDANGVGCRHYAVGAKLAWQQPLGDWLDRDGRLHGDTPYATASAGGQAIAAGLTLDVTPLARQWLAGERPATTGILLRAMQGSGTLQMPSREATEGIAPQLILQWRDGRRDRLALRADATLDCSTTRAIGTSKRLRIGPQINTLLVFEAPAGEAAQLLSATLSLSPERLYGKSLTVGAFSTQPPWAVESVARNDGIAARYRLDEGIGGDAAVLFAAGFEHDDWLKDWKRVTPSEMAVVEAGEGNGFRPLHGKALRTTLKQGANTALNLRYLFAGHPAGEPEEVYFRYYLRLGDDWKPDRDGGKLPGLAGTYGKGGWGMRKSDGTNGWSARGAFGLALASDDGRVRTPLGSYVYHADMKGQSGGYWGWGQGPGGVLRNGRWYAIEQYIKLNTPGQHDGVLRAWIDGHLVAEYTGLSFRTVPALRIESVWMNVYHGGTAKSPRDMSLYIDNVVVAREYIGPMSGLPAHEGAARPAAGGRP